VKPDPALFGAACESLGVEPWEAVMVGGSALRDGGAVDAGIPALLLPPVPPGVTRGLAAVLRLLEDE
jgi:FMN phosphatase YigB (HAD superfamily)